MAELYRKASLERLSSPEQLDRMIKVTSPLAWLSYIGAMLIIAAVVVWSIFGRLPQKIDISGIYISSNRNVSLTAQVSGVVKNVDVSVGDIVQLGDTVMSIRDGNGSNESVKAIGSGVISSLNFSAGDFVFPTDEIAKLMIINDETYLPTDDMEILCYVPVSVGKNFLPGMDVMVSPVNINEQEYGNMVGTIKRISNDIINTNEMMMKLGNEILVNTFQQQGPVLEVVIKLKADATTKSGYMWSNKKGNDVTITTGTMMTAKVIMKSEAPIVKLFPFLKDRYSSN